MEEEEEGEEVIEAMEEEVIEEVKLYIFLYFN